MHRLFSRWTALVCLAAFVAHIPAEGAPAWKQEPDSQVPEATSRDDSVGDSAASPAVSRQDETGIELQADGNIRFKFVDAPWSEVIQFFAEQADFSLQPIETEPEGTFKYHDDQAYTVMEALDQLNYALALRGFTLVRNKRLLVLVPTERNIPDDLIETVQPDELDQRGKHEILKCVFDLEGLEDSQIAEQIEGLISRNHNDAFHVVPSAKQMIVREKGQTLRTIRAIMESARTKGENRFVVGKHQLEHIDPESVFEAARVLLDLDANNQAPDGQFKVMVQPLSTQLIFRGSAKNVQQFKDLIAQLDVSTNSESSGLTERPYLKQYSISGDLEAAFKVIQTMMAGRDVKFDIDKSTSKALLLGHTDDHKRMEEVLLVLASGGEGFAVIELKHISTAKAMTILEQLYQRDTDSDEKSPVQGPVFFADETNSRLIVKGMPQEVAAVKLYLEKLDVEIVLNTGPRTTKRIIQLDGSSISPDFIEDLFSTTGRENRLQIYMPKDLKPRGSFDQYSAPPADPDEPPSKSPDEGASKGSGMLRRLGSAAIAMLFAITPNHSTALVNAQDPAPSESNPQDEIDEPKSVPGADVEVKITEYGIVLTSDDLDALDELESILRSQFEELSASARPGVFYLKWRDPKVAKSLLEKFIGQGSSSSSSSDPLSNLIGAGVNNMIPGMGDLFGGGGSSASTAGAVFEMEGTVVILADEEMRALIVAASQHDMDIIASLITDYIDQPGAPHDPKIQGEFYTIPVIHRDPAELKTTLETMLPDLIRSEDDQIQAGQNQAPEQQILRQLMQARGGGQQQADEEQESPKAVLGVDEKGHALLVSGPPFIYEQILTIVQKLDSPELSESSFLILPMEGRNAELIAQSLKASLGEKIEYSGPGSNSTASPNANQGQPQVNPLGGPQAQQQQAERNAVMQALQQQMNRGNRGQGQQNRGNRGGGGRGGQGGQGGPEGQIPGIQFQRGG